ncbi:MAG: hypothetical protein WCP21_00850 [Armatimonadota bacterium]
MHSRPPFHFVLLLSLAAALSCMGGFAQDQGQQPAAVPPAPIAQLVLSASVSGAATHYQGWPLVLELTLWREMPPEDTKTPPGPLAISAKQGSWSEALVVRVTDGKGSTVQWLLHLVKQEETQLSLPVGESSTVQWWLAPEDTKPLTEGDYTIGVAFDPQRVDGLPTGADAPRADTCVLHIAKEPAQLDAEAAANKLCQHAWYCVARDDRAGADADLTSLLAADPQSIAARRVKAFLLARDGKVQEGLALVDEAMRIYAAKHPKSCPPFPLIVLSDQLRSMLPGGGVVPAVPPPPGAQR